MKYLMQILLGLILLQLLQSCDYSKSRDVLWMKKNFENNAELFFDVTNLFILLSGKTQKSIKILPEAL